MKKLLVLVLVLSCIASPAYARTRRVKPRPTTSAAYVYFDYSKAVPPATVAPRHIEAAKAIRAELDRTALPGTALLGVDFWAQGLADQEAAR